MFSQVVTTPMGWPVMSRMTSDMSWTGKEVPSFRKRTRSRFQRRMALSSVAVSGFQFAGGERSRPSMRISSSTL